MESKIGGTDRKTGQQYKLRPGGRIYLMSVDWDMREYGVEKKGGVSRGRQGTSVLVELPWIAVTQTVLTGLTQKAK